MSKSRIERLERADQSKQSSLVLAYQAADRDYMRIQSLGFSGTIEEGNAIIKANPRTLFVIHHIPRSHL